MSVIRFHFDEHIDTAIAVGLRLRGVDVTTTAATGLMEASDREQIAFATSEGRVLVTCDRGIAASIVSSHTGIAIAQGGRKMIGPTVHALTRLHRHRTAEEMLDTILYL